jgi:MscS family membrane protein
MFNALKSFISYEHFITLVGFFVISTVVCMSLFYVRKFLLERVSHSHPKALKQKELKLSFHYIFSRTHSAFLVVLALALGSLILPAEDNFRHFIVNIFTILLFIQSAIWGEYILNEWVHYYLKQKRSGEDLQAAGALSLIKLAIRVGLWAITIMLILRNLGFDITVLLTGFGVGGIAVGLAAQRILSDLFASLSIILDKPFIVGDYIIFGDIRGTVEEIGLKTTRLRSQTGEEIICSNTDLLNTRIRNYQRLHERRNTLTLHVSSKNEAHIIQMIPQMIEETIRQQTTVRFDRAHFLSIDKQHLVFEAVYWVESPDYKLFMDIQQNINNNLFKSLQEYKVTLAEECEKVG